MHSTTNLLTYLSGWEWWEYVFLSLVFLFALYITYRVMRDWFGHIDMG